MGFFGNKEESEKTEETTEKEENEPYYIDFSCENCEDQYEYEVPFGTTKKEFLKEKTCEYCGCKLIQPSEEEQE